MFPTCRSSAVQPPQESVPSTPPLLVIEILSKDDRYHNLMEKLEEYRVWGVPNIWVVDPLAKRLAVYSATSLARLSLPWLWRNIPLQLTAPPSFNDL